MICSRDTSQQLPYFDRCQLIITWMSNIKEVHSKLRLHVSVNLLFGVRQPSCVTAPCCRCRRRRCAYAPTSNTASHDNHEKINSWVSFCYPFCYPYRIKLFFLPDPHAWEWRNSHLQQKSRKQYIQVSRHYWKNAKGWYSSSSPALVVLTYNLQITSFSIFPCVDVQARDNCTVVFKSSCTYCMPIFSEYSHWQ